MNQSKTERPAVLVDEQVDAEVVSFRTSFDQKSPLDELVREGARRMLQSAIDAEVESFIAQHEERRDGRGRRLVVKNGSLPEREILTGAATTIDGNPSILTFQPRPRGQSGAASSRSRWTSASTTAKK